MREDSAKADGTDPVQSGIDRNLPASLGEKERGGEQDRQSLEESSRLKKSEVQGHLGLRTDHPILLGRSPDATGTAFLQETAQQLLSVIGQSAAIKDTGGAEPEKDLLT